MSSISRSILARSLMAGMASSLAFVVMGAAGARAETMSVVGTDGMAGEDGVNPGDGDQIGYYPGNSGQMGDNGGSVSANAGSVHPITNPSNDASAQGGNGGAGGFGAPLGEFPGGVGGYGGNGGAAAATAATTIVVGPATANASAYGGNGGGGGLDGGGGSFDGNGGIGGSGTASATARSGSGSVSVSASAGGGAGGYAYIDGNPGSGGSGTANATGKSRNGDVTASASAAGGDSGKGQYGAYDFLASPGAASASSTAVSGSGNAASSANATAGSGYVGGNATATAHAVANMGGRAVSEAVATGGKSESLYSMGSSANATASAKSSFDRAGVQSTDVALAVSNATGSYYYGTGSYYEPNVAMANAVAQAAGAGQSFVTPSDGAYAFSTVLLDKADVATLIGGASNVASDLLRPRDTVFGTAILGANYAADSGGESRTYSATSTFDFGYGGDLLLGLIASQEDGFAAGLGFESLEFTITDNGTEILDATFKSLSIAESFFHDSVIDLGSSFVPIDLTFGYTLVADGSGGFGFDLAVGGAVPEPSTWAMMLLGFAGLSYAAYRRAREARAA